LNQNRFYDSQNDSENSVQTKNAVRGVVYETKTLANESTVSIRLSEAMKVGRAEIPTGSLLIAVSKFQGGGFS
jgi:hypothetical protein